MNCPPILEVEDQPVLREPLPCEAIIDLTQGLIEPSQVEKRDEGDQSGDKTNPQEPPQAIPKLGPEQLSPTINEHAHFWSTYDRVAGSYDKELLDAWNKSLDVLLIFAGLFSAINTAFIIESYKGLQPDPVETTNALLRLFISHRNDNVTLTLDDMNTGFSPTSAVPINSLFFSSLSFSLTAAFGAVTAKQWLTEYANVGAMKALHIQGRKRQEKYTGLNTWHLRLVIELLPMLLQISLLLFLVGIVHFLWILERKVATLQLVLSGVSLVVYLITMVIGIAVPASPFQTPLSRHISPFLLRIRLKFKTMSLFPIPSSLARRLTDVVGEMEWVDATFNKVAKNDVVKHLQSLINLHFSVFRRWKRDGNPLDGLDEGKENQWDPEDITAAESVVWLLEQAEHPDATIAALDAFPRLPPDLLLYLIKKHEGLMDRLIEFHNNLLPIGPPVSPYKQLEWVAAWPSRAVVSGMALFHILRAEQLEQNRLEIGYQLCGIDELDYFPLGSNEDALTSAKLTLNCGLDIFLTCSSDTISGLHHIFRRSSPSLNPNSLYIEVTDTPRTSTGISFATSISELSLALDTVIHLTCLDIVGHEGGPSIRGLLYSIPDSLISILEGEVSRAIVSHVAITTAACHLVRIRESSNKSRATDLELARRMIPAKSRLLDKGQMILENVAFAISIINYSDVGHRVYEWLLAVTSDLFLEEFQLSDDPIPYSSFPQDLLRLARVCRSNKETQLRIVCLLARCPDGDWASPFHEEFGADMMRFLDLSQQLWPFGDDGFPPEFSALLEKMVGVLDDTQLLGIIESPTAPTLNRYCKKIANGQVDIHSIPRFVTRIWRLNGYGTGRCPGLVLEMQIAFALNTVLQEPEEWGSLENSLLEFFNRLLSEEAELHWPAYFVSAGIACSKRNAAGDTAVLKFINPKHFEELLEEGPYGPNFDYRINLWRAEALLLLWRKGRSAHANDGLSPGWDEGIFFHYGVRLMLRHLRCVQEQMYSGVEWALLREYFGKALDERLDRWDQWWPEMRTELEAALQTLNNHLDTHSDLSNIRKVSSR